MLRAISSGDKSTSMRTFFHSTHGSSFFLAGAVQRTASRSKLHAKYDARPDWFVTCKLHLEWLMAAFSLFQSILCSALVPSVPACDLRMFIRFGGQIIFMIGVRMRNCWQRSQAYWLPCARYIILMVAKHLALYANELQSHWTGGKEAIKSWKSCSYGAKKMPVQRLQKKWGGNAKQPGIARKKSHKPKTRTKWNTHTHTHTESWHIHTECTCQL